MARGASYNLDELIWKNRGEGRNNGCPRLASLIRDAREGAGLDIDQLAQLLSLEPARINVWETGTEGVNRADVEALRAVFPDTDFSAVRYRPTPHHGELAHIPTD